MLLKVDCLPNAVWNQPSIPLIYFGRKWTLNWWWWWWWCPLQIFWKKNRTHPWIHQGFKTANFWRFTKHAQSACLQGSHPWQGWETSCWLKNKAMWVDTVPVWIMKSLRAVFAQILTLLINISISQVTFPSFHKCNIICPRLKNRVWIRLIQPTTDQYPIYLKVDRACDTPSALDFCLN